MKLAFACVLALCGSAAAQGLTLSPAAVPLGGQPGQSTSQHLTLLNTTGETLAFALEAKDVIVRDGARAFVDAGDLADSIAATAVFSTRAVRLRPGEQAGVDVRLTLPAHVAHRAVVVLFESTTAIGNRARVSIGTLITFDLGGSHSLVTGDLLASPPTASTNATFALTVGNDGCEPAIVKAAAVVVRGDGAIAGRLSLASRRLLPGEQTTLAADYAGELPPGRYRVIATLESAQRSWTRVAELVVP